jgi:hypothetical protein
MNDELHITIWKQLYDDGLSDDVDSCCLTRILVNLYERVNALEKRLERQENYEEEQNI